nr:PAS domain S-box protein [uncultured Flavobacterium sp.]
MSTESKWSNFVDWFVIRPKTSGFLIFLVFSIGVVFLNTLRYQILKDSEQNEMNIILKNIHQNIEESLRTSYGTTVSLALCIDDNGIPQNFEEISRKLLESNPVVSAVELVPNGAIKYIYPLKGNEAALNLNILDSSTLQQEARKSIKTQQIYFAGPLKLKQGGMGIVGRIPVYNQNKFWGFTAVVIKFETLLNAAGINSLDQTKYYFQFSKVSPITNKEEFFLPIQGDISKNQYVSYVMPQSDWKLYLIKKEKNGFLHIFILPLLFGIFIAAFLGVLTTKLLNKPKKLQLLVDAQVNELQKNEMKFKSIFDQATVGFAIVDANSGDLLQVNEKYCSMLGYSEEEINKKNFSLFTHPDDVPASLINLKNLRKGVVREYSSEKRYLTKTGEIIWVSLTVSPLWKVNEKPTVNIAFIKDITITKQAQELIEKSETRFRSLFDNSLMPLWEEDFSGVKKYLIELDLMNKSPEYVYSFFNENPDEFYKCISLVKIIDVNYECLKLHKVKDKPTLMENLTQLIDSGSFDEVKKQLVAISQNAKQFSIDSRIKNMLGEYRDINLRWSVIQGYEESYERVILSTEDITERKASEKIIINSQKNIKSLIDTIDGIVWEFDIATATLTFISKKVEKILGYSVSEYLSCPTFWEDHIYSEDKKWVLEYSASLNEKGINHDYEYRMLNKKGEIVWIRDIINFVFENDVPVSSRGIMIDITKTKQAENDLSSSLDLVTEQNKRLLNFSYIVSHNLRSHSSNIESITSLIEFSESEEETLEMVQLLKKVTQSLNDTMHNLNEVVNIKANINIVSEPLNLRQYSEEAIAILTEQIAIKDVQIINNIASDVVVVYNPAYMQSIFLNLISNAIRYSHSDRKPEITIDFYTEKDKKVLQISDNGIGIDLNKNGDKIFGMYKTFSTNSDSKGIGLFITKNQIDAMGGSISVESEPYKGTTFKIYI